MFFFLRNFSVKCKNICEIPQKTHTHTQKILKKHKQGIKQTRIHHTHTLSHTQIKNKRPRDIGTVNPNEWQEPNYNVPDSVGFLQDRPMKKANSLKFDRPLFVPQKSTESLMSVDTMESAEPPTTPKLREKQISNSSFVFCCFFFLHKRKPQKRALCVVACNFAIMRHVFFF